jgi:hypothetical protein
MPGLVPGIHVLAWVMKTWMAGTTGAPRRQCRGVPVPAMTPRTTSNSLKTSEQKMAEQVRGAGQPSWPASPYQIELSYGARGAGAQNGGAQGGAATASAAGVARGSIVQGSGADWFGPLDPLSPIAPPDVAGRRFDFPVGFNLITRPRGYEPVGFAELRGFADAYDLLRIVIETRKDQMERQRWRIRPRDPKLKRQSAAIDADMTARIGVLEAFFQKPDGVTRWKTWASIGFAAVVVLGWIVEGAVKWTIGWALSHFQ